MTVVEKYESFISNVILSTTLQINNLNMKPDRVESHIYRP
jgi:hypothetical protein